MLTRPGAHCDGPPLTPWLVCICLYVIRAAMSALYQQVYAALVARIATGRHPAGSKLPSDATLAAEFATSRQTILRAMERLRHEGRIERRQGQGSFVRVGTRTANRLVALLCADLEHRFGQRLAAALGRRLQRDGYELLLAQHGADPRQEAELLERLLGRAVDGIVLIPALPPANRALVMAAAQATRVVCADHGFAEAGIPLVASDHRQGARDAVDHLLAAGHRRIGLLVGAFSHLEQVASARDHLRGYQEALTAQGLAIDPALIAEVGEDLCQRGAAAVGHRLFGYQPMQRLLHLPDPPTAVVLLRDELAPGALAAAADAGRRVPDDLSLVGFNDDPLCALTTPPLTSVAQDTDALATALVEALDLDGGTRGRGAVLPVRLVLRSSSAALHPIRPPPVP